MAMNTGNSELLIRTEVWSSQLKMVLEDQLMAAGYVNWLSEFPDGTTFTIPSVGQAQVEDYIEDDAITYAPLDTGEFQLTINKYKASGIYITDKAKQDSFYMNQLVSSFVPKQERAIMEQVESDVLGLESEQTASDLNAINGANHRYVAGGSNEVMEVEDFARARYALKKANVPDTSLIAIVDPSVEYALNTITNLSNISNNPHWEGVIAEGIATGMRFVKNVYGFDVYVSNNLADANETISGVTTAAGKANMFFSAEADVLPFIGAWRQMPQVESERNKDHQRDEFVITARYGVKLFRPENLVCVLSDTDQVS
jgi:hypothetical protein|tara:strand:- start:3035 stop:3976 length:942 start_codon:yes stop_codon:yes gene_type:complete